MQSHRKRNKHNSLFIISYLVISISISQSEVYDGLTLITSKAGGGGSQQNETHLIDNEHNILNSWLHNTSPASIAYLSPDSILFVPCKINNQDEQGGPMGGRFIKMDWSGDIIWDYIIPDSICIPHHDIAVLPNGNILAICSETKTQEEAVESGIQDINGTMTLDMIIEIQPLETNDAIFVWEWHFWDHLVQDINSNLQNYGQISENHQLLNINSSTNAGGNNDQDAGIRDWNHCNSISFNSLLNQIVISSRHMNEFYIIDHSTTIQEASGHTGGIYGIGGDILYRWGNPQNYNRGGNADQILNSQHGVNWIPEGYPGEGNFILFNNNHSNNNSAVLEISPPINSDGSYIIDEVGPFGPESYLWMHQSNFYSGSQSGAFRLPNGNTIITVTNQQLIFEVNQSSNTEWTYSGNLITARAIKYSYDYFDTTLNGDLNGDGAVNVLDVISEVNLILENEYQATGDLNSDGEVNILDVVALVSIILNP